MTAVQPAQGRARAGSPPRPPLTPGRRAALAIGVPLVLAAIVASSLSYAQDLGHGSYPVSFTVPATAGKGLSLSLDDGNATVRGEQVGEARVAGTVHYSTTRPSVRRDGGAISVGCPGFENNCYLDATMDVPRQASPLHVSTHGGTLAASGLDGAVTLATRGGNLMLADISGTLSVTSDGGDVQAGHLAGTPAFSLGGGNLTLADVTGTLSVRSGGGDVQADHLAATSTFSLGGGNLDATAVTAGQVTVTSEGGDVTLAFTRIPRSVDVTSGGGNVTILVPRGGRYALSTHPGGGSAGGSVRPANGGATSQITVDSSGGDINVSYA